MAVVGGKFNCLKTVCRIPSASVIQRANFSGYGKKFTESVKKLSKGKKYAVGVVGTLAAGLGVSSVAAGELLLHPPKLGWSHRGLFESFDHRSIRRGYQVYKQVCAACHTIEYLHYREFVGVFMTEDEAKAEAAEAQVEDGPNEEGQMFMRPGKLFDTLPRPYKNDEEAKAANNGAMPPDLTFIVQGREGTEDYIFHLLTGYADPPANFEVGEGQYYNPYFHGGAISMAQALYDEIIEYDDGTPATRSQLAKDVSTFLAWVSEPEHDTRKRYAIKGIILLGLMMAATYYYERHIWTALKSRKLVNLPKKKL